MEELDVGYHDGASHRREVKYETFEQIYDKAGVPAELRGPGHHFFVTEGPNDGPLELWPIPSEIAIEGVVYALREDGAHIAKTATVHAEAQLGSRARVGDKAWVYKGAAVGVGSIISKNAVVAEGAKIGNDVRVGENTQVRDSAEVGERSTIAHDTYIGSRVQIGNAVKIGANVRVEYDAKVGSHSTIDTSAIVGAKAQVGDRNKIGASARIAEKARMGNDVSVDAHLEVSRRNIRTGTKVTAHRGPILKAKYRGSAEGES